MAAKVQRAETSFRAVFQELNKVLWLRTSLIVMGIMFFDGLVFGYGQALMPIAAVNLFGYTTPQWSQLVAMMGLSGAVLALAVGPAIDRVGAKGMLLATIALFSLHAFLLAQTQHLWDNTLYVRFMLSAWVMMQPVVMVSSLALAMTICKSVNSATQFAIYMSVANFGHSAGSKIYGVAAEGSSYAQSYTILGAIFIAMIVVILLHRHSQQATQDQPRKPDNKKRERPRYTIGG